MWWYGDVMNFDGLTGWHTGQGNTRPHGKVFVISLLIRERGERKYFHSLPAEEKCSQIDDDAFCSLFQQWRDCVHPHLATRPLIDKHTRQRRRVRGFFFFFCCCYLSLPSSFLLFLLLDPFSHQPSPLLSPHDHPSSHAPHHLPLKVLDFHPHQGNNLLLSHTLSQLSHAPLFVHWLLYFARSATAITSTFPTPSSYIHTQPMLPWTLALPFWLSHIPNITSSCNKECRNILTSCYCRCSLIYRWVPVPWAPPPSFPRVRM